MMLGICTRVIILIIIIVMDIHCVLQTSIMEREACVWRQRSATCEIQQF